MKHPVKTYLAYCFLLCGCITVHGLLYAQGDTYGVVMGRVSADIQRSVNNRQLASVVERNMHSMMPSGSWADVHYDNPEFEHLARLEEFATAYIRKDNPFYGDAALYADITAALQYWLDKNPKNRNWWFNDISFPQHIGQILILMRYAKTPLPRAMEEALIQRMMRKLKPHDFANTSDEALHYLYRACLTRGQATMDSAVTYLFEPVAIQREGEGLQYDNSYLQHGRQQAIASYGAVFVGNSYDAAGYLDHTPYAMASGQLDVLSSFFKDTYLKSVRGTFFDFNVRGRGISRHDGMKAGTLTLVRKAQLADPAENTAWQAAAARATFADASYGVEPSHTNYWVSGYTLHARPGYSFNVQVNSIRTLRTERGNNENILGKFLPDGATDIQRRGPEYFNIMPVWEWDKIPGVTNREYASEEGCTIRKEWGIPGTTGFSGGLSDSVYGVTAYDLDYDSVKAHKSWFFFDKEILCLGAGISSDAPENITTTVNQCWLNGNVRASGKDNRVFRLKGNDSAGYNGLQWVLHDSIGYFFPLGGDVHISNRTQSGNWYHINHSQPQVEVSGKVFKIWLAHGAAPAGASYAYLVVPGVNSEAAMRAYDAKAIRVIRNSPELQAVEHTGLDMLQVVFFAAGTLTDHAVTITVDKPCIVMIKQVHGPKPEVYVADPAQRLTSLQVALKLPADSAVHQAEWVLPKAPYAGNTLKLTIGK